MHLWDMLEESMQTTTKPCLPLRPTAPAQPQGDVSGHPTSLLPASKAGNMFGSQQGSWDTSHLPLGTRETGREQEQYRGSREGGSDEAGGTCSYGRFSAEKVCSSLEREPEPRSHLPSAQVSWHRLQRLTGTLETKCQDAILHHRAQRDTTAEPRHAQALREHKNWRALFQKLAGRQERMCQHLRAGILCVPTLRVQVQPRQSPSMLPGPSPGACALSAPWRGGKLRAQS